MLSEFLFSFVFCWFMLAIYDRVKYGRIYNFFLKFPGPINIPLIGAAYEFRSPNIIADIFLKYFYLYGSTFSAWICRVPVVIVTDPKHLKIVLNNENCLDKEKRYQLSKKIFGNGLLIAPGKAWKKNRKIINPTFNQKILNSFFHIFAKHSQRLVEKMETDIPKSKIFNIDEFVLGSDTTSNAVGYALICLGALKDIQKKVYEELHDIFGESNRPIFLDDLPKLQYLERVIKETIRLFPVAPFLHEPLQKIEDFVIPKGASIIVPLMGTHKNEKYWPNPLKFDPDRFLPSEVAKRHPYSYLPFSGSPRNCIGKQYAMMSMKIILANIVRTLKIDTNIKLENIRFKVEIGTRILGGSNISIENRQKQ